MGSKAMFVYGERIVLFCWHHSAGLFCEECEELKNLCVQFASEGNKVVGTGGNHSHKAMSSN